MKKKNTFYSSILFFIFYSLQVSGFQSLPYGYPQTDRQKININTDWAFYLEKSENATLQFRSVEKDWEKVNLPHGLELFSNDMNGIKDDDTQPTFQRAIGWYSRSFNIEAKNGEKIFLEFEGAHQITNLWVNGKHVGEHSIGGYTPFHFDITDYVNSGSENTITVSADNRRNENIPPDGHQFDYIKFGGLYRDVYLVKTNPLHISFPWEHEQAGVSITTPSVTETDATINVKTNVVNEANEIKKCTVLTRVIDDKGRVVLKMKKSKNIVAGANFTFTQTGGITENLHLWSPDQPYLYRVNTLIYETDASGKELMIDCIENPLGIRWFDFIIGEGFFVNGKNTELVGANRHQAYPFIGDAVPNSLHWKDAYQFKQAGFNVVRLAHYPHDNSFIEACDELGILIFEEPPTWIGIGNKTWFNNLEEATRRMIRNHRNHPSILMWGASLNHRGPVERLHYAAKEEDPTRVTASNGSPWTGPRGSGICDLYTPMDYQRMPIYDDELSFLCEHGSSSDANRNQYELSRSRASKNRIGIAVWTAHDYHSYKKNRKMHPRRIESWYRVPNEPYYWYQSELLSQTIVHVADERVSKDAKVVVFSNCQEIILKHDGKIIARQFPDLDPETQHVLHPSFTFDFDWSTGKIEAIGLQNGQAVKSHFLQKNGKPKSLELEVELDGKPFFANGSDIKMLRAKILDENGQLVRDAQSMVTFSVEGVGILIGEDLKDANPNQAYHGVASAFIRSNTQPGVINIVARANGLGSASIEIETQESGDANVLLAKARPIYDEKRERVDIGGVEQFVQFGWMDWTGGNDNFENRGSGEGEAAQKEVHLEKNAINKDKNIYHFRHFPKAQIEVESNLSKVKWTTSWGMSSPMAYLGMDGISVDPEDELSFKISHLPKGKYDIRTWHHIKKEYKKIKDNYKIEVEDANGKKEIIHTIVPTSGHYLEKKNPAYSKFFFISDGQNDIYIRFRNNKSKLPIILNGFEIKEDLR